MTNEAFQKPHLTFDVIKWKHFPHYWPYVRGNHRSPWNFQRAVVRSFGVVFDLHLNKQLSVQSWRWWFERPSRSLWRHCIDLNHIFFSHKRQILTPISRPRKSVGSITNAQVVALWGIYCLTWRWKATFSVSYPDSKVRRANMGPIWSRQDPGGLHFGPMNFAIWIWACIRLDTLHLN